MLTIDSNLGEKQLDLVRTQIFTNPVTEESSFSPMARDFDWLIWVGFRPGVRDTAGSTAVEAIEDLLDIRFGQGEAVYTSKLYDMKGSLSRTRSITLPANFSPTTLSSNGRFSPEKTGTRVRVSDIPFPK